MTRKKKQKDQDKPKKQSKTGTENENHNQQDATGSPSQVSPEEGELREKEVRRLTESRPRTHELMDGDQSEKKEDKSESRARSRRGSRHREPHSGDRGHSRSRRNAQSPRSRRRSPKVRRKRGRERSQSYDRKIRVSRSETSWNARERRYHRKREGRSRERRRSRSRSRRLHERNSVRSSRSKPRSYRPRRRSVSKARVTDDDPDVLPIAPPGRFGQAMTSIAGNAGSRSQGIFNSVWEDGSDKVVNEQLTWALAQKFNLGSTQQANEKALKSIVKKQGSTADLKQAIKARAAVYGSQMDPSWYVKSFDLSAKLKTSKSRRQARGVLLGAPLFVAQVGAHSIRGTLNEGERSVLKDMNLATRGTAGQFMKALARAPILEIVRHVNSAKYKKLREALLQHADDLDYTQTLISSVCNEPAVNPSMNAVNDAFLRRRFAGRFKKEGGSVELDTLLHQATKGERDDDDMAGRKSAAYVATNVNRGASPARSSNQQSGTQGSRPYGNGGAFTSNRPCFLFQTGECFYRNCNFSHECLLCGSRFHGSDNCDKRGTETGERPSRHSRTRSAQVTAQPTKRRRKIRPPHPRYRRDRATDRTVA